MGGFCRSTLLLACSFVACGPSPQEGAPIQFSLVPVAQFGSVDGALALQRVTGLSLSPGRSRLYVSQWGVQSLLVLSREGDSISSIGRGGGGPGEFSGPTVTRPRWTGDTLWVADLDRTVVRFDSLGNFIDQRNLEVQPLGPYQLIPQIIAPLPEGMTLVKGSAGMMAVIQGRVTQLPLVRIGSNGEVIDTVSTVSESGAFMSITWPNGSGSVGSNPFGSAPRWAVSDVQDPRIVIADLDGFSRHNPVFHLYVIGMTGDTVQSGAVPVEPVEFSEAHIDQMMEDRFLGRLEDGRVSKPLLRSILEDQVGIPSLQPPVSSMLLSRDGSIWLEGPHRDQDSISVTVLEGGDLSILGRTALPRNVGLIWVSLDEVWARAEGRSGESYILRFEPRWNP